MSDTTPDNITLSDLQGRGVKGIVVWFKTRATNNQQIYRVFGYAGAGKSTIVKYALKELGMAVGVGSEYLAERDREREREYDDIDWSEFGSSTKETIGKPETITADRGYGDFALAATFTGKAAAVLRKKGTPCQTIHSLIYKVHEATEEEINKHKEAINKKAVELAAETDRAKSEILNREIGEMQMKLKDMGRPKFSVNEDSILRDANLLVLDEVSMVDANMARDLMGFGKPILVLGDPGQLPPIKGEGFFTEAKPDIFLDEIHRQALESPIIRLSMMAREGKFIPFGEYSDNVMKLPRGAITAKDMLNADQVICGYNATRMQLNSSMLAAAGFTNWYPTGKGEKIICLRNMNDIGLINGMFLTLTNVSDLLEGPGGSKIIRATITTDEGEEVGEKRLYLGHFEDHVKLDKERDWNDRVIKKGLVESTWGNAITVHKSQGSGWTNVIFFDDGFGRTANDRKKLVYTAITRAEEGLLIVAN